MSKRKGRKAGTKSCVARHRGMSPRQADALERHYERQERARGRAAAAEGLADHNSTEPTDHQEI